MLQPRAQLDCSVLECSSSNLSKWCVFLPGNVYHSAEVLEGAAYSDTGTFGTLLRCSSVDQNL